MMRGVGIVRVGIPARDDANLRSHTHSGTVRPCLVALFVDNKPNQKKNLARNIPVMTDLEMEPLSHPESICHWRRSHMESRVLLNDYCSCTAVPADGVDTGA